MIRNRTGSLIALLHRPQGAASVPIWITPAAQSTIENAGFAIPLQASVPCFFTITGGADAAKFSIGGASVCNFAGQDFDHPDDSDENNVYVVTIRATNVDDATKYADRTFNVTVIDDPTDSEDFTLAVYSDNERFHLDASNNQSMQINDDYSMAGALDVSRVANHMTQTAPANQPAYVSSGDVNNLPCVRFSPAGTGKYFALNSIVGRDLETVSISIGKLWTNTYWSLGSYYDLGPTFDASKPQVVVLIMNPTTIKWRLNGTQIYSGDNGPFFQDVLPAPGIYFAVVKLRAGTSFTAIYDRGNIGSLWSSPGGNVDIDISEMIYYANTVPA